MKAAFALAFLALALSVAEASSPTTITPDSRTLPVAPLGPCNPWPRFRFQLREVSVRPAPELSAEDREGMVGTATVSPMPYLMQDNYTRQRRRGQLPTVTVENGRLRAVFYPSLGGRMISLYDKRARRELLFNNPVFQPANLAIRNAWFSGGIEWNGPLYGHSLLTCSPVFAGVVETPSGPLLRLYEFDRSLETTWQVDVFLPAEEDRLWVHVRALNPNPHDIQFYWWTNIAVPLTREMRVLSPADYALAHVATGLERIPFPNFDGFDGSYPHHYPYSKSVFFRKPGTDPAWSAYVDAQGRGLLHVSTPTLFGRKLFVWGNSRGGKRWMDYLAEPGRGDYIEIQGGVTPTQLHTRPLKAGASLQWTECLAPFAMDAKKAHHPNYAEACAAAATVLAERVPSARLREVDRLLAAQVDAPTARLLYRGSAWGRLHEKRTGRNLAGGLAFECEPGDEERAWLEVLEAGTFSADTLAKPPKSFVVSPGWQTVLTESAQCHGWTWLHHLHLGVARLEAGAFDEAKEHFRASAAMRENAHAHRNLALLYEREGHLAEAQQAYERAWALAGSDANLAVELCAFLLRNKRADAFDAFVRSLPVSIAGHERIRLMLAQVALERGDFPSVRRVLLQREFCTIREGEISLTELWFASHMQEAQQRKGRELTPDEKEQIIRRFPPPTKIDFRMK